MKKKEKGQGMVEFALVLPIMLFIATGIAALFYLFGVAMTAHNAISEAGRAAQVWRPDGVSTCVGNVTAAVERITPFFDLATDTITFSENCSTDPWARIPSGNLVELTIVINWEPIFYSTIGKDEWDPPTIIPITTELKVRHE